MMAVSQSQGSGVVFLLILIVNYNAILWKRQAVCLGKVDTGINVHVYAYGAAIGWMSPMSLLLQSPDSPRATPLTDIEVSWIASVPYIVCIPGTFALNLLCDAVGRKTTLLLLSVLGVISWGVKLSSMELWAFLLARMLVGITMAGAYVACPLYTKEISEDSVRGALGSLLIFAQTSGNLFLYVIGDYMSYRGVLWTCLALPAAHFVLFLLMPESPSYLVKRGRLPAAARSLAWLRCRSEDDPVVAEEIEVIKKEQEIDEQVSQFSLKVIVQEPVLRRAFFISMCVCLAREVCGAIPVLNFAGEIFERASSGSDSQLALTPNQQAMVLGVIQVAGAVLASSIVEKTGRKPLLFLSALVSGASMCVLASWFVARAHVTTLPPAVAWLPVVTLCLCIFCDASGMQPLSVVLIAELFSYRYRGTVMATTMASASLASFLQMLFFKPVANSVGIHVAFYFFGGVCLLAAVYVILVVPETKQRTVEQIYDHFRTNKHNKTVKNTEKSP